MTAAEATPAAQRLHRRRLGRTQMEVTELALGGVGIGGLYGPVPEIEAARVIHRALQLGINYLDTSPLYMESEERIGRAFVRMGGKPNGLYLSTKTGTHPMRRGDYSAAGTRWSVENSLRQLGVPSVDCVLLHDPRSNEELELALGPGGAVEELERMRQEGKLRAIGLGVREHHYHRRAINSGKIDVILTYADYNLVNRSAGPLIQEAADRGVGVILAQVLLGGLLGSTDPSGDARLRARPEFRAALDWHAWAKEREVSLPAVAIQFALRNPHIGCALVGAKAAREVEENVAAITQPIPAEIWREVIERIQTGMGQAPTLWS